MHNLFVVHTQYNLVLACGLSKTLFQNEKNDLMLFSDFMVTERHQKIFEQVFDNIFVIEGAFPKRQMKGTMKLRKINEDIKKIRKFIKSEYNRVFIVEDMCIQEMYIMKLSYTLNHETRYCWLEDGATAYYRNGVVSGGMGGTMFKRMIRKIFFSTIYNLGSFYDLNDDTGIHKKISEIYVIYPDQILDIYKTKKTIQISEESFNKGMKIMYSGERFIFPENSVLIAMDLLKNYKNKKIIICDTILSYLKNKKIPLDRVYIKYHPRETETILEFENFNKLDKTVGIENYLSNSTTNKLTLIGVMSTALLTARKMGYSVLSLANSTGFSNKAMADFYNKIGIKNI